MLISELINKLNEYKEAHGDCYVYLSCTVDDPDNGGTYDKYADDITIRQDRDCPDTCVEIHAE